MGEMFQSQRKLPHSTYSAECISFLCHCCHQISDKKHLKGLLWLTVQGSHLSWQGRLHDRSGRQVVTLHLYSGSREELMPVLRWLSPLYLFQDLYLVLLTFKFFSPQLNVSGVNLHEHPKVCHTNV